ncbi:MAG: hypothetical protein A4E57_04399 [Syntrophorhabdaceae bacterium PtaU1.Bin034]|nr:MAG: hypothetical protein A4E57_04399 [Syntrophorhabdaceae bacterium PtaU1.Bin034]
MRGAEPHVSFGCVESGNGGHYTQRVRLYVGTSGFAYKEWKGKFYPEKISPREMLHFYSARFNAVEINSTFYRMPNRVLLEGWAAQVPEDFVFALKAPRTITHDKRLTDVERETEQFLTITSVLGRKLGPVLFQFPATFRYEFSRLEEFVGLLSGRRAAFEFRHGAWLNRETFDLLRSRGCVFCITDREQGTTPDMIWKAGWGYLRLRQTYYCDLDLSAWRSKIASQEWESAYVFFKHEPEALGPKMSASFRQMR